MKVLLILIVIAVLFAAPVLFAKVMLSMTKPMKSSEILAMEEATAALLPRELARLHLDDLAKEAKKIEAEAERAAEREANIRKKLGVDEKLEELRVTAKEAAVKKVLARQEAASAGNASADAAYAHPDVRVVGAGRRSVPTISAVAANVTPLLAVARYEDVLEEHIEGELHDPSV